LIERRGRVFVALMNRVDGVPSATAAASNAAADVLDCLMPSGVDLAVDCPLCLEHFASPTDRAAHVCRF
jgi:hypothetical protein